MNEFKLLRGYSDSNWWRETVNAERRVFQIDVGNIDGDVQYFIERLRSSLDVPAGYFRQEMLNEPPQVTEDIFIPVRNDNT
jgi:hypothetical protein